MDKGQKIRINTVLSRLLWYNNIMKYEVKSSETVTITKVEYESLKELKEHCAQLESELNWLKEQLQINKKKTFGSSFERTEQLFE